MGRRDYNIGDNLKYLKFLLFSKTIYSFNTKSNFSLALVIFNLIKLQLIKWLLLSRIKYPQILGDDNKILTYTPSVRH